MNDEVEVSIGPIPSASVLAWASTAWRTIEAIRTHQELGVPGDVADGFEAFVREWVATAEVSEPFVWRGRTGRARVRRLSAYWLMLVTQAREHPGKFGIEPAPPEGEEFFNALAAAMAEAISSDDAGDDYVEMFEESVPAFDARFDGGAPDSGPLRVLVVDDVDDVRLLLRVSLGSDPRFEVVGEATNGQEALDIVDELRPDAVVLDVMMPVMDGLTALPLLLERLPELRVVVVSAADVAVREEAMRLGAAAVLPKTTPLDAIKEAVAAAA